MRAPPGRKADAELLQGCVPVDLTQAAEGWRSCAEGVPKGRSAASASSALSSEGNREGSFC